MNRYLSILILMLLIAPCAQAEVIKSSFGKIIPVKIVASEARSILFELPLDTVDVREDSGLTVRSSSDSTDMLIIDAAILPTAQDVFVVDIEKNRYHLRIEMVEEPQDAMLFIQDGRTHATKYAEKVKETPLTTLLVAMAGNRRLDGFGITKFRKKPKRIYFRDGLGIYVHRIYKSGQWTGYVTTVENTNDIPVAFDVRELDYPGLVAIGSEKDLLARKPKLASEIRAAAYKTRMEFVVDTSKDINDLGALP